MEKVVDARMLAHGHSCSVGTAYGHSCRCSSVEGAHTYTWPCVYRCVCAHKRMYADTHAWVPACVQICVSAQGMCTHRQMGVCTDTVPLHAAVYLSAARFYFYRVILSLNLRLESDCGPQI